MDGANNNLFSGRFEGNLLSNRFVFDGLETSSLTKKTGFRCHNFITSLFVNIFGSGTIDIETDKGIVHLNKGSVKNVLQKLGDENADTNDSKILKTALENLLKSPPPQEQQIFGDNYFYYEGDLNDLYGDPEDLENNEPEHVQEFFSKDFLTVKNSNDRKFANTIKELTKNKPEDYLTKIVIAFSQLQEPFEYIAVVEKLLLESTSEEELLTALTLFIELKERLEKQENTLKFEGNTSEQELEFIQLNRKQIRSQRKSLENLEKKFFSPLKDYLFKEPTGALDRFKKIASIFPQFIDNNKITYLSMVFQKYTMKTESDWKYALKFMYEMVLKSNRLNDIKNGSFKKTFEKIRDIVAPDTNIPW